MGPPNGPGEWGNMPPSNHRSLLGVNMLEGQGAEGPPNAAAYMDIASAAKALGIGTERTRQLLKRGQLAGYQDPDTKRWYAKREAVEARLAEHPPKPVEDAGAWVSKERLRELHATIAQMGIDLGTERGRREQLEVSLAMVRDCLEQERDRADRLEAEVIRGKRSWWSKLWGLQTLAPTILMFE